MKASRMASVYIENVGGKSFNVRQLPVEAQFAPLNGVAILDINDDGNLDILGIGNSYASETLTGYYDASIGSCLQGDGAGNFTATRVGRSGFFVDGDGKAMSTLMLNDGTELILATQNRDSVKVFSRADGVMTKGYPVVRAQPLTNSALITLSGGKKRKHEFYYGNGYLSSSSRAILKSKSVQDISMDR